jgi:epoxyqueuosine reductase
MMRGVNLAATVKQMALETGFDLVGIAPADVGNDLEFARQWVERGFSGEMRYLANPKRAHPRRVLPSLKSVICVGLIYDSEYPYSTEVCNTEGSKQKTVGSKQKTEVRRQESEVRNEKAESSETSLRIPQPSPLGRGWPARGGTGEGDRPRAWISRYAWGKDYHRVMRIRLEKLRQAIERLAPGAETRVFVDTGPVVERAFARFSGIGWMGKNTCIIDAEKGSWFFLGVILTNLELAPDLPAPDRCGSCTACLEACPTGALVEPYVMDATRCISYLTIELKGSIPAEHHAAVGANVFGCDICQDVCPWNSRRGSQESEVRSRETSFRPLSVSTTKCETGNSKSASSPQSLAPSPFSLFHPLLEDLASFTEDDFRRVFAHSPVKRAKYFGWLRNLCVAMGNSGDRRFIPWLEQVSQHPDPVVSDHARWALDRLQIAQPKA